MTSREVGEGGGAFEVRLLGPVRVVYDGRALDLGGVQARSVLAVLMLMPGQVVPRDVIAASAWRGQPPETARELVGHYVSRLRSALAPVAARVRLEAVRPGFRANIDPGLIDAHRFTALVRRSIQEREAGEDDLAVAHIEQALTLWKGRTLALEDLEAAWLRQQAVVLQDQRWDALERLAALRLAAGQPERAVQLLRSEAPRRPERDSLTALLVSALSAAGQGALAVETADRAIDALDQVGLPVGPRLRAARRHAQRPPAAPGRLAVPRQLPPDTSALTGRERELAELLHLADHARGAPPGVVVICAVDGMAGIGKTALAIHAGHRLAQRFPDGQLFVDLHGFTRGLNPRAATDVLADVLRTLGVPPQQIPDDLAARAALYRDRLSGKRMLVVLDNANSEDQIRPLMPGHPACLVLVTSRRRLKGLDEACVLSLEVLPAPDAVALLRAVAGPGRLLAGDPLLEEIAHLCGRLPLALRIAAALLRHRPSWRLAHLAGKLRHTYPALAAFHDGDRDLAALFDLSYQALDDDQQRLYRHLGLNPGPDIDPYAAAALLQDTPARAERLLEDLIDHSLLLGHAPGRYRMHDLIRDHTRALSAATDPAEQRQQAQRRLLDYYQHTATRANALITHTPRDEQGGCTPPHAPTLKNAEQARMWLRSERASLEAAFDHAAKHGWDEHTVPLGAGMAELLHVDGPWPRAVAVHEIAVAAARRVGDQIRLAAALTDLGKAHNRIDDGASATNLLTLAHQICRDHGDRLGQANVLAELSIGQIGIGNYQDAHDQLNQALMFYRELDNRLGQAHTLTLHACIWQVIGDSARAIDAATHALSLYRDLDNPQGQVGALNFLGRARALNKDYAEAEAVLNHALDLSRGIGHRLGEAVALAFLGTTRCFAGEYAQALETLGHALTLLRELGDRSSEANTLNYYAVSLLGTGDTSQALATYRDALFLARDVSQPDDEALALEGIGECLLKTGDTDTGIDHLRQALKIYQHLGLHPDIERVQTRLVDPAP